MRLRQRKLSILICLIVLFLAVLVFSSVIGAAKINPLSSIRIIMSRLPLLGASIDISDLPAAQIAIIANIRLPRILLSFVVGFALSVVGVSMQGMLKNPMADPFIIGTSSGAAFGAAIAIVLKLNKFVGGIGIISLLAFIGALLATALVYSLAKIKNKVPVTTLLLAGIATGQFFTAITSFLMVISSKDVNSIIFWTMGSFSARGWAQLRIAVLPVFLGSIIIYFFSKDLNILLLGEANAQNTGVAVERVKKYILVTSALITAVVVSVSGIIGFIGLIIPHIMRMLIGPDHRVLIPSSGILGGVFLIAADTLARTIIAPTEIPVGIITAIAGGPFFIYLLRKNKRAV